MSKRQRRQVLSEEDYQKNLSVVIQRQFYPDLPRLEEQVAVQQRRWNGDAVGAAAVRRAAGQLHEHEEQLREQERLAEESGSVRTTARPLEMETLTGFHARVTSEDNAEFDKLQQQQVQESRRKRNQMLQITSGDDGDDAVKAEPPQQLLTTHPAVASPLRLASDQFAAPASVVKKNAPVENSLFFVPEHVERETDSILLLMPPPSNSQTTPTSSNTSSSLIEYIPKNRLEKKIEPAATRFPKQQLISVRRPAHWERDSSVSEDDGTSTDASTDLDSQAPSLSVERRQAVKRKVREHESLVQMTPVIVPGRGLGNESPIVTWGSVSATPLVLVDPSSAQQQQPFQLPEPRSSEWAAEKAQVILQERLRKSRTPNRKPALTPVGLQMLTTAHHDRRPETARSASAFGTALRSAYQRPTARSSKISRDHAHAATPRLSSPTSAQRAKTRDDKASDEVTDGLLRLPK